MISKDWLDLAITKKEDASKCGNLFHFNGCVRFALFSGENYEYMILSRFECYDDGTLEASGSPTSDDESEDKSFSTLGKYMPNVMLICWRNGYAERIALGKIQETVWEAAEKTTKIIELH